MKIKVTNKLIGLLMIFIGLSTAARIGVMTYSIEQNTYYIIQLIQVVNDSPYVANVPSLRYVHIENGTLDITSTLEIIGYLLMAFAGALLFIDKPEIIPKELRPLFFNFKR